MVVTMTVTVRYSHLVLCIGVVRGASEVYAATGRQATMKLESEVTSSIDLHLWKTDEGRAPMLKVDNPGLRRRLAFD